MATLFIELVALLLITLNLYNVGRHSLEFVFLNQCGVCRYVVEHAACSETYEPQLKWQQPLRKALRDTLNDMPSPQGQSRPDLMKPLPALPSPKYKSLQIINEDPEQEREYPQTPIRRQTLPTSPPFELHIPNYVESAGKVRSLPDASSLKSWRRTYTLITPDSSPDHSGKKSKACLSHVEDPNSRSSTCMPLVSLETDEHDDHINMQLLERLTTPPSSDYRSRSRKQMVCPPRDSGWSPPTSEHRPFTRKTPAMNLHQHYTLASGVESSRQYSPDAQRPISCHSVDFWTEGDDFIDSISSADHEFSMEDSDTEMTEAEITGVRPSFLALLLGIDKLRARV